jgi:hypothetical protein
MKVKSFDFKAAFEEICQGMWGVWVGEHGFLVAVFGDENEANTWAEQNYTDYGVEQIELEE